MTNNPLCPRLLICEGYEDKQFFKLLIHNRGLPDFKVIDTRSPNEPRGGISNFKRAMNGVKTGQSRRFATMSHLVLVADNDETPDQNFSTVRDQVEAVFPGRSPRVPWQKTGQSPSISILMIPAALEGGIIVPQRGSLERFCCEAARAGGNAAASHIDKLLQDAQAHRWDQSRQGKAWLRSNIAIRASDPCAPLGEIFRDHGNLFDLRDQSLAPITGFLADLA